MDLTEKIMVRGECTMIEDLEANLVQGRDRLNALLAEVKDGKRWSGDASGRETIPVFICQIQAAIDQIELAPWDKGRCPKALKVRSPL